MKTNLALITFLLVALMVMSSLFLISEITNSNNENEQKLFGIITPVDKPVKFAPDLIASELIEFHPTVSPDYKTIIFSRFNKKFRSEIWITKFINNKWSKPKVTSFSGKWSDASPSFSKNGKRLYFMSNRPVKHGDKPEKIVSLWYVDINEEKWSEPACIGYPEGFVYNWWTACIVDDDEIYFGGKNETVKGKLNQDLYKAKITSGKITDIEPLKLTLNTPDYVDSEPALSLDGNILVFYSAGRKDQIGEKLTGDLYISFKQKDGSWSEPAHTGKQINTAGDENWPVFSPDGKYLMYSSPQAEGTFMADIFWIDIQSLLYLRK